VDVEQSYKLGVAAVKLAIAGRNAVMPIIERVSSKPYRWRIAVANLSDIANKEKMMPRDFITGRVPHHAQMPRLSLAADPGEAPPPFKNGLPDYVKLRNAPVPKKLPAFKFSAGLPAVIISRFLWTQAGLGPASGRNLCSEVSGSPSAAHSSRSSTA